MYQRTLSLVSTVEGLEQPYLLVSPQELSSGCFVVARAREVSC